MCRRRAIDIASAGSRRCGPAHRAPATWPRQSSSVTSQLPLQSTLMGLRGATTGPSGTRPNRPDTSKAPEARPAGTPRPAAGVDTAVGAATLVVREPALVAHTVAAAATEQTWLVVMAPSYEAARNARERERTRTTPTPWERSANGPLRRRRAMAAAAMSGASPLLCDGSHGPLVAAEQCRGAAVRCIGGSGV